MALFGIWAWNFMLHYSLHSIPKNKSGNWCFPSLCWDFLPHPHLPFFIYSTGNGLIGGTCLIFWLALFLLSQWWHVLCWCDILSWVVRHALHCVTAVRNCWFDWFPCSINRLSPGSDVYVTVSSIALARSQQCRNSPSNLSTSSETGSGGGTYRQKSMPEG